MTLYFITKQFQARRLDYDPDQNVLWLDPNFKEHFLRKSFILFQSNSLTVNLLLYQTHACYL